MKLTDINIRKAKSDKKVRKLSDGGGLFLQIEPTGGKLWRYKYRFEGKQKLLALGKYPDVPLQEARKRHTEAREQLAQGVDPSAVKKAQKAAGKERAANTFEVIAREWFDRWKTGRVVGHSSKIIANLQKNVFPLIGGKPIDELTRQAVMDVLNRLVDRGVIDTAHRTKATISRVMQYAIETGRAKYSPVPGSGALPPVQTTHMASITEPAKVAELLRAIEDYQGLPAVRAALRLAPLVFARPGELRLMKWSDIDLDQAEWKYTVSKTKTDHLVPLSRQAVEILKYLHPLTGSGEYVFPGIRPGRAISDMTLNRALQTMGYDTKTEMTGHGFRAMARTLLAERLHFPAEVIEHQLAHKVPDSLGMAYNRTKFLDDRRRMMSVWADYLDELKAANFEKVVPFDRVAV